MAFPEKLKIEVQEYINKHHPNQPWWQQYFDLNFVSDSELSKRLVQEMMAIRSIYQLLEGLRVQGELLRAQAKIQIITYASVYESVLHHNIFKTDLRLKLEVQALLLSEKYVQRQLRAPHKDLSHNGEKIYTVAKVPNRRDERYIKFEEILNASECLGLVDTNLSNDLLELYNIRNAIHLQAEIIKGVKYELDLAKKAHELLRPFKRQIIEGLKKHKVIPKTYNVRFTRKPGI